MNAGRDEPERCRAAVHVGDGVDLGTPVEQNLRDVDGVLWSPLAKTLDAISTHVMQKRRVVLASGTCANQLGIAMEQLLERRHIAAHDRIERGFESCDR